MNLNLVGAYMPEQLKILIIVENLTMPLDRRVWQEATTLRDEGHQVTVICPKGGEYTKPYEFLDGIHVYRHPLPFEADRALGYALEYGSALFWEFLLSIKVLWRHGFDVIQACNPPDTIFLLGGFYKYLMGKAFIFDHHDINPELFEAKFGKRGFFHRLLTVLEKLTFMTADTSIATNGTFKRIAIERGKMDADNVFIVRSIPDLKKFKRVEPDLKLKNGRKHLIGYVGIMGAQDGVDILIEAMADIVHRQKRTDIACAIVGSGTELNALKEMSHNLGLDNYITFTGFLSGPDLLSAFSAFNIGAIPDPKNTYNDKISMNKVFEYMSLKIPFVQFDLGEGREIAGEASLYAENNDPKHFAEQLIRLTDDGALREELGGIGAKRAAEKLNWEDERSRLLTAYAKAMKINGRKRRWLPLPGVLTKRLKPST